MPVLTPGPGTDGNHSCGLPEYAAPSEDLGATFLFVDDPAFHAAGNRHDLPCDVA